MKHLHSSPSSAIRQKHQGMRLPGRDFGAGMWGWYTGCDTPLALWGRVCSRVTQAQQHTSLWTRVTRPAGGIVPVRSCCFRHCAETSLLSLCSLHLFGLCLRFLQPCKSMGHKYLVNLFYRMSPAVGRLLWKKH